MEDQRGMGSIVASNSITHCTAIQLHYVPGSAEHCNLLLQITTVRKTFTLLLHCQI